MSESKEFDTVLYTVKEAAQILECSERTIFNYIKAGKMPFVKIAGKWRITKDNLTAFVNGTL